MNAYESEYIELYKKELYNLISNASPDELKVCRAWDKDFGIPGYGGVEYVSNQLNKARKAIAALNNQ